MITTSFLFLALSFYQNPDLSTQQTDKRVTAIAEWRQNHPGAWILRHNRRTQEPSLLFGGAARSSSLASNNRSPKEIANDFLTEAAPLFGVDPVQFKPVATRERPIPRTPQSATYTVAFEQRIQGGSSGRPWGSSGFVWRKEPVGGHE